MSQSIFLSIWLYLSAQNEYRRGKICLREFANKLDPHILAQPNVSRSARILQLQVKIYSFYLSFYVQLGIGQDFYLLA